MPTLPFRQLSCLIHLVVLLLLSPPAYLPPVRQPTTLLPYTLSSCFSSLCSACCLSVHSACSFSCSQLLTSLQLASPAHFPPVRFPSDCCPTAHSACPCICPQLLQICLQLASAHYPPVLFPSACCPTAHSACSSLSCFGVRIQYKLVRCRVLPDAGAKPSLLLTCLLQRSQPSDS